jgi:hypothetical protein
MMRQHDLVDTLHRPFTLSEQDRVVDRTGQVWKEKTGDDCSLEQARAFLVVGPPVRFASKKKGQAYVNHPVVDFPGLNERFYRSENVDEKNKNIWSAHYEKVL